MFKEGKEQRVLILLHVDQVCTDACNTRCSMTTDNATCLLLLLWSQELEVVGHGGWMGWNGSNERGEWRGVWNNEEGKEEGTQACVLLCAFFFSRGDRGT